MYADHHVLEVRRILFELPGVMDVYASSCFKIVEVSYDPGKVDEESIQESLAKAGYLGDLPVPEETGSVATRDRGQKTFFRQAAVIEQAPQAVSFGQVVITTGRPLWPCPGMGPIARDVIKKMEE